MTAVWYSVTRVIQSNLKEVGDLEEKEQEPSRFTHYNFKRVNAKAILFTGLPGIYQVTFLTVTCCKQLNVPIQVIVPQFLKTHI